LENSEIFLEIGLEIFPT